MSDLKNFYAQMWHNSIGKFKHNDCELDPLINNPADSRRGITVLSYFDQPVASNISTFLDELKIIEPNQYYYPQNELHLTILSIISCVPGFKLSNINVEAYAAIFQETLESIEPFAIHFKGITISPSCVLIQGFPNSQHLKHFRDLLRENFKKANLESTIDSRYKISTAHSTVVRCITPFKNNHDFINVLTKYKNHDFGTLNLKSLALVFNNWYQQSSITKNLSTIKLKP